MSAPSNPAGNPFGGDGAIAGPSTAVVPGQGTSRKARRRRESLSIDYCRSFPHLLILSVVTENKKNKVAKKALTEAEAEVLEETSEFCLFFGLVIG